MKIFSHLALIEKVPLNSIILKSLHIIEINKNNFFEI